MSYLDVYLTTGIPRWENTIPWLYKDSLGYFTTGQGIMLPNLAASLALPWQSNDLSTPATEAEIASDWNRVSLLPGDKVAGFYHTATSLMLKLADIQAISRSRVTALDAELAHDFPSYATAPDPAKIALLDMGYNLGEGKLRNTYPHFDAAFDASNWFLCAKECTRDAGNAGFKDRNAYTVALFTQAASA